MRWQGRTTADGVRLNWRGKPLPVRHCPCGVVMTTQAWYCDACRLERRKAHRRAWRQNMPPASAAKKRETDRACNARYRARLKREAEERKRRQWAEVFARCG